MKEIVATYDYYTLEQAERILLGRNRIKQWSGIRLEMLFKKGFENTNSQKIYIFVLKT